MVRREVATDLGAEPINVRSDMGNMCEWLADRHFVSLLQSCLPHCEMYRNSDVKLTENHSR